MALGFVPIEHYKTKFYQKEKESKRFTQITDEQLSAISDKVYKKMEIEEESSYYRTSKSSKLDRYIRALLYLTSPNIHFDIKTFDERLAYLIMMVDPNLVTFKEFLKINLVSLQEIANTEDVKLRNKMLEERKQTLLSYETAVRDQIGFFDVKLLKFEELFFKRFYAEKELITEVGQNNQDNLLLFAKVISDFNCISDERYAELVENANLWLSLVDSKYKTSIATYSVLNQKKLLGLNSLAEQFVFFILVTDRDLDMLRIYEEESMMPNVEERIIDAFGYYNKDLLVLERKFHERFCPDKKLSVWSELN